MSARENVVASWAIETPAGRTVLELTSRMHGAVTHYQLTRRYQSKMEARAHYRELLGEGPGLAAFTHLQNLAETDFAAMCDVRGANHRGAA